MLAGLAGLWQQSAIHGLVVGGLAILILPRVLRMVIGVFASVDDLQPRAGTDDRRNRAPVKSYDDD